MSLQALRCVKTQMPAVSNAGNQGRGQHRTDAGDRIEVTIFEIKAFATGLSGHNLCVGGVDPEATDGSSSST
jgi:hypothetical protein